MKLSFSQLNKFNSCARSYKHYYQDRLREKTASSFLVFGNAMDQALNAILLDLKKNKKVTANYLDIFDKTFEYCEINKRKYKAIDCILLGYSKNDFVEDLLTKEDLNYLKAKIEELAPEFLKTPLSDLKDQFEAKRTTQKIQLFPENEHKLLNIMNYLSMRRKGHHMLNAYVKEIVPEIEEVRDIQLPISLDGGEDSLIGYVDAIVKFKGDSHYSVMDNKTSASPYEQEDVMHSQQLALYCYATGLEYAAFAVMLKNINLNRKKTCSSCGFDGSGSRHKTCNNEIEGKRCNKEWIEELAPEGKTQLFKDEIPERIQLMYIDNVGDINTTIKAGIFAQNFSACHNQYGQRCSYYEKCWKNKEDNLEKV